MKDTITTGRASEKVWILLEKITRALLLQYLGLTHRHAEALNI